MTDEQRTTARDAISIEIATLITSKAIELGADEGDVLSIAVGACAGTAVAFAATKATSAAAAVTLVSLHSEAAAKEIYE